MHWQMMRLLFNQAQHLSMGIIVYILTSRRFRTYDFKPAFVTNKYIQDANIIAPLNPNLSLL